jgi:hypothetical protein
LFSLRLSDQKCWCHTCYSLEKTISEVSR